MVNNKIVYLLKNLDMENLHLILIGIVFVSSSLLWWKKIESVQAILATSFAASVLLLVQSGFDQTASPVIGIGLSILFVSLFFSLVFSAQWILLVPIALSGLYLILLNQQYQFDGSSLVFTKSNALFIPVVGAVLPVLAFWKARFIQRFLSVHVTELENVILLVLLAFGFLFASIFGANYGLFLLSIGFLSTNLAMNRLYKRSLIPSVALIGLSFMLHYLSDSSLEIGKLTAVAGVFGMLLGTASIGALSLLHSSKTNPTFFTRFFLFLLPMAFIAFVLFLETQKEHTAGFSAWFGIGISFVILANRVKSINYTLFIALWSFLILAGVFAYPSLKMNEEFNKSNEKLSELQVNPEAENDLFSLAGISFSDHTGEYTFTEKNSKISFELGKEGAKTKGLFTAFSGKLSIPAEEVKASISVELPVKNLSTFNDYRDESLRSAVYFDEAKFPKISFNSTSIKPDGDAYVLTGDFTMKGITKSMDIRLKVLKSGEEKGKKYILFIGKSSLDRSNFGMDSDPKIGDIVDFTFEIEAIKN